MNNGLCDVKGCQNLTLLGWRPLTERRGRKICEQHWRRHQDEKDSFDLFDEFKFRRRSSFSLVSPSEFRFLYSLEITHSVAPPSDQSSPPGERGYSWPAAKRLRLDLLLLQC
jgi:hypothetical protein